MDKTYLSHVTGTTQYQLCRVILLKNLEYHHGKAAISFRLVNNPTPTCSVCSDHEPLILTSPSPSPPRSLVAVQYAFLHCQLSPSRSSNLGSTGRYVHLLPLIARTAIQCTSDLAALIDTTSTRAAFQGTPSREVSSLRGTLVNFILDSWSHSHPPCFIGAVSDLLSCDQPHCVHITGTNWHDTP